MGYKSQHNIPDFKVQILPDALLRNLNKQPVGAKVDDLTKLVKFDLTKMVTMVKMFLFSLVILSLIKPNSAFSFPRQHNDNQVFMI